MVGFIRRNAIGLTVVMGLGAWLIVGRCTVRQELGDEERSHMLAQLHVHCVSEPCAVVLGLKESPEFERATALLQRSGVETHPVECTGSDSCWNAVTELGRGFGGNGTPVLIQFPTILIGTKIYRDVSKLSAS